MAATSSTILLIGIIHVKSLTDCEKETVMFYLARGVAAKAATAFDCKLFLFESK